MAVPDALKSWSFLGNGGTSAAPGPPGPWEEGGHVQQQHHQHLAGPQGRGAAQDGSLHGQGEGVPGRRRPAGLLRGPRPGGPTHHPAAGVGKPVPGEEVLLHHPLMPLRGRHGVCLWWAAVTVFPVWLSSV